MTNMKRLAALALSILMMFTMVSVTFAAPDFTTTTGTITISNAKEGETYKAYKIFDVTYADTSDPADETPDVYSYTITTASPWYDVVKKYADTAANGLTLTASATNAELMVVNAVTTGDTNKFDPAAFAAYLYENIGAISHDATGTAQGTDDTDPSESVSLDLTVTGLGYYFVTTTIGSLCSLDTTDAAVTILDKNPTTTIVKTVKEDSTQTYGETSSAQIGDTVPFRTTIMAYKGAVNYVVHDKMTAGLTFDATTVVITADDTTQLIAGTDYELITDATALTDGCTFEIKFTETYLATLTGTEIAPNVIVIDYAATLNETAKISDETNDNETWMTYGEDSTTTHDITTTLTYEFDIVKVDGQNKVLDGAKFVMYDATYDAAVTTNTPMDLVMESAGVYRVATADDATTTTEIVTKDGIATIKGLDIDTYYLEETEAPNGYNILDDVITIVLQGNNKQNFDFDAGKWTSGIIVVNQAGSVLPETGGIGTTIFYAVGGILVLGAAVLLVTKKRIGSEK